MTAPTRRGLLLNRLADELGRAETACTAAAETRARSRAAVAASRRLRHDLQQSREQRVPLRPSG